MGNMPPGMGGDAPGDNNNTSNNNTSNNNTSKEDAEKKKKKKRFEPRPARHHVLGPVCDGGCFVQSSGAHRVKDFLSLEQEFIRNQDVFAVTEEREKLAELRGSPLAVGSLEELIDDNHCIVSSFRWCK
jgi:26S proteasome regulatory subunit T2